MFFVQDNEVEVGSGLWASAVSLLVFSSVCLVLVVWSDGCCLVCWLGGRGA